MLYFSRWKTISIWAIVLIGVVFALPNALPQSWLSAMPNWMPKRQMTLGLDLQGGSHILLQIDRQDLIDERLKTTRDDIRTLLRDAKIGYTGLTGGGNSVQVRIRDATQLEAAKTALASLLNPVASSLFGAGTINELALDEPEPGVLRYTLTDEGIDYRVGSALTQSIEVVGRRVNELGTTEPIIQRQGNDRILVQVPGLQDPQRLKDILGQTAKLTFQMVDQTMPVAGSDRGPSAGRRDGHVFGRRSAGPVSDRGPRHRLGREPGRCAGVLRPAHQRAGRLVPLRFQGRAAFRPGDPAECRQAVCHHPRRPGDLGAADPRADPRRHRPDFRQLHRRRAPTISPCCCAPARCRPT